MHDPLDHRQLRDRLEEQLRALQWNLRMDLRSDRDYTVLAGVVRKALAPQLAQHAETTATLERVRAVLRQHRGEDTLPTRQLAAALHGDEDYLHVR